MLITKETADIEKILIDFLSFLNENGYINDYDFVYETQIKKFINQIKLNKMGKITITEPTKPCTIHDVMLRFKLRLNVEEWGMYKKGDEDYFNIKLHDEQNGLTRFPINKRWDVISCEIVNVL